MATEETLVEFDEIYDETYNKILKYVVLNCKNLDDAKDIVQNVYLAVLDRLEKEPSKKIDLSYIKGIASHKIKDYYRFNYRTLLISIFTKDDEDRELIEKVPTIQDIESITIQREEIDAIWKYIKKKDPTTSHIFFLYYYLDYSIKAIAIELNITESYVKNRLYRTLKELKKIKGKGNKDAQ